MKADAACPAPSPLSRTSVPAASPASRHPARTPEQQRTGRPLPGRKEKALPPETPSTWMCGPWREVMTRSLFQVPASRIPSSSLSRMSRSRACADCARRPQGTRESAARHAPPDHIAAATQHRPVQPSARRPRDAWGPVPADQCELGAAEGARKEGRAGRGPK